jgi:hypothetical protein
VYFSAELNYLDTDDSLQFVAKGDCSEFEIITVVIEEALHWEIIADFPVASPTTEQGVPWSEHSNNAF